MIILFTFALVLHPTLQGIKELAGDSNVPMAISSDRVPLPAAVVKPSATPSVPTSK